MKSESMARSFTTYSGTDMVATFQLPGEKARIFGNLSEISYSIYRAKYPVLALGRITPKGFTRGIRSVTGRLTFLDVDQSIVYDCIQSLTKQGYKLLMDELPMFDVTISFANEYGSRSKLIIYGITTVTEGKMMSIDQLMQSNTYEFYALDISPLMKLEAGGE